MPRGCAALVALALSGACASEPTARIEPILFGDDDRIEPYELTDTRLRDIALGGSPALFHADSLDLSDPTDVAALGGPLGDAYALCPDERWVDEWASSYCSATLVDDDLVVTAGHCVDGFSCEDQRYVFGWWYDGPGAPHPITADDVYACRSIVTGGVTFDQDVAVIQLDRAVVGRRPVEIRTTPLRAGDQVLVFGYPSGLRLKISPIGLVQGLDGTSRFYHTADTLPGSSGSGVYDAIGRWVGVHYAAPDDAIVDDGPCNRFRTVVDDAYRSGSATTASTALTLLCDSGYPTRLCALEASCGDGYCTDDETASSCLLDCSTCGDGTCGVRERCPVDCPLADAGPPSPPSSGRSRCSIARSHDRAAPLVTLAILALAGRRLGSRARTRRHS